VTSLAYGMTPWPASQGADRYRRGLYTFLKRTAPYAAFTTMDAPSSETVCVRRERSNTPLQALTLLNDIVFVEAARALAVRVLTECPNPCDEDRISHAFRLCLARGPHPDELAQLRSFRKRQLARLEAGELGAARIVGRMQEGGTSTPMLASPAMANQSELASWTIISRVILNLDETVTKE
jgi:hypothetical protein